MPFVIPKDNYTGRVAEMQVGSGDSAVSIGGEGALPFLHFEGEIKNRPVIAMEIQDVQPADWPATVASQFESVWGDPVQWAKYCQDELKAQAIALRLVSTHPDGKNTSAAEAAETVKKVLGAVNVPLVILGSNHAEKDSSVLVAAAEAAKGRNCIIGKAQEANYKTIVAAALAHDHKIIAMSELDINLAKQLNILITQMGYDKSRILTDPMCSALGYGLEYTYSVMERIRLAGLTQNDSTMQPPIMADVGFYVWKVKEVQAPEADLPEWGALEERALAWESVTATALAMAGAELIVMRHPKAIAAVGATLGELM